MKKDYNGNPKKGGIYQIRNLVNGKVYIGSTKLFTKRAWQHQDKLNKNNHHNHHLMSSWNKYGSDKFIFEVIEVVEGNKLARTTIEQKYINNFLKKWKQCYNLVKNVVQPPGKCSEVDFARNMSKLKKAFYETKRGKEVAKQLANNKRGKSYEELFGKKRAKEIKDKIKQVKLVQMNKPEMKENLRRLFKGKSFTERFGKEKAKTIKQKQSKSRKGKHAGREHVRFKIIEDIKLMSPDGKIYTRIEGIKNFALQHNLNPHHFGEILSGKRKTHKGWGLRK